MEASKEACIGELVHDHGSVDLKEEHFFAQSKPVFYLLFLDPLY
jgi:hypothetical protein